MNLQRRTLMSGGLALAASTALPPLARARSTATLRPFVDEAEMREALQRWHGESRRLQTELRRGAPGAVGGALAESAAPPTASQLAAPAAPMAAKSSADAAGARGRDEESITNVQTAGVDEGGIVKRAGDHLLILRRGRLFTVRIGGDTLAPAAAVDAYAPGSNPSGAWYDELLVAGSTVVVVGYSYARGGTEIVRFELGADGSLRYRSTHHLRSFDYYSARNYASRLIGHKLIFYTPTYLSPWQAEPWARFPAWRHWQGERDASGFQRILPATRVYRTDDEFAPGESLALHTVTTIDLATPELRCESTAVLGPAGRVFYVSQGSVYVWTSAWPRSLSAVFRLPLDGSAPSAIKTAGVPVDQMSFLEEGGHLNVLLRESGRGEAMWGSEHTAGGLALLRVPLGEFGDGRGHARREHYRSLPSVAGGQLQNRFVGEWLLWGGLPMGAGDLPTAWALRYASADGAVPLAPGHGVERIEALGRDAVLIGNAGSDLHFSAVRLARGHAQLAGRHAQIGAAQGESRTHGFFYRAQADDEGVLGLPTLRTGLGRRGGVYHGAQGAASVVYLRNRRLQFSALGALDARDERGPRDDACKASCVDWYGNARPIFLGERVFALLGYELVEGRIEQSAWRWGEAHELPGERLVERRRISFAPTAPWREGRYSPFN
ncbi:MAG: beta-propeller domain-containing protein [Burkholderiaceae bacterium]|nr:beta-propeller domain-containing protein [Burkholderiaceae bacterium]